MKTDEIVKTAESIINKIGNKDVEDKTIEEYIKIFNKVIKDPQCLYEGSKGYYYKKKAALRYSIHYYIIQYLQKIRSKSVDERKIKKFFGQMIFLINLYKKHGKNTGTSPVSTTSPGNSKKYSLRRMPKQGREMVWNRCENYKYKGALAILQLTGARPSEIERGVSVTGDVSSDFFEITIRGSKQGKAKRNGQATRTIKIEMRTHVSPGSPKNYLLSQVAYEGHFFVQVNAKRLNDYVRRLSQKIWPQKKNQISPYSYRHQISADLKGEGCPPPKISMALGHRSTMSKKKYAGKRQSRGNTNIVDVSCSHALREPPSSTMSWEQAVLALGGAIAP